MANGKELTAEVLRDALDYDPETGDFTWRFRPNMPKQWTVRFAGKKAGCVTTHHGYVSIVVFGRRYWAHRLAWLYVTGKWPEVMIDHRNGLGGDNRISNLRECDYSENQQNRMRKLGGRPGYIGVGLQKSSGRWQAYITIDYKMTHLGFFDNPEDARDAYLRAKRRLHPFQPIPHDN
jgi:hypothetical protein